MAKKSRAQQIALRARGKQPLNPTGTRTQGANPEPEMATRGAPPAGRDKNNKLSNESGLGLPGTSVRERLAGLKGKERKAARPAAREARRQELLAQVPEEMRPWVKNPKKWLQKRGGQPFGRMAGISTVDQILGLTRHEQALEEHLAGQLNPDGTPKVNFREEEEPVMSQMEGYIGERLGSGFTPAERAAYYGSMHDPLMAQAQEANENQMTKLSAAGIDPRSGVANARAAQVQAATARGLAEAGRQTEQANLQRKAQIEGYAQDMGALEERKRSGMVESELGRLGKIEEGMGGLAGLGEKEREFNYELAEGQRQANIRRQDIAKAAERAEPSTLEKVSGGLQGFLGGLGA